MKNNPTISPGSESLYRSLIEQLPVGIFRKDAEGRYVLVNAWFCKLRGKKAEEILGKTPIELMENNVEREVHLLKDGAHHHEEIMRTGKSIEVDEYYPSPTGEPLCLHVIKSP